MKRFQKVYLQLFLVLCVAVSLTSILPTPVLSHQAATPIQIAHLDECAADAIAPSTPQSEGAYVANSNTGKFHYAGCRYVNMMSPSVIRSFMIAEMRLLIRGMCLNCHA
jgi:hypothetical protein